MPLQLLERKTWQVLSLPTESSCWPVVLSFLSMGELQWNQQTLAPLMCPSALHFPGTFHPHVRNHRINIFSSVFTASAGAHRGRKVVLDPLSWSNFKFHARAPACLCACAGMCSVVLLCFWFISRNVSGWAGCLIISGFLLWVHSTLSSAAVRLSGSHYWIATVKTGMQLPLTFLLSFLWVETQTLVTCLLLTVEC